MMFVWCLQVMAHSVPQSILDDVAMVSTSHRNIVALFNFPSLNRPDVLTLKKYSVEHLVLLHAA